MLVMGLSGGLDLAYQNREFLFSYGWWCHDAAAVIVNNGEVVAAIEEERLNRIKHTSKAAVSAMRFCLDSYGATLRDLDQLAVYGSEPYLRTLLRRAGFNHIESAGTFDLRKLVHEMLDEGLGEDLDDSKISFIPHHLAHAISAYAHSGFDKSLILTVDGGGDNDSGIIIDAEGSRLIPLHRIPQFKSLGQFYVNVIQFIGFSLFEEFKVMGLAPYGDPKRFRRNFQNLYTLLPNGDYLLEPNFPENLLKMGEPRKKNSPITQRDKDIATALQETLEDIVMHILKHYQKTTKHRKLCLAGGVAHNCSMNGKIIYSGIFDEVFVQPASHDAGCAIGAAIYHFLNGKTDSEGTKKSHLPLQHVYWGTDVGNLESIRNILTLWKDLIDFDYVEEICEHTAQLLAGGYVVGWVQGRSEFGPRALGNRSILADPRPAENKDIINSMVKKREAFRPFAPAVLEEYVDEYFEIPPCKAQYQFMTFVVKVQKEKHRILGATTHVDGTARIQTVSKQNNKRFWDVIDAFCKITGIPILLNTSFNNNLEPIVDSVNDAVECFLTTQLPYLIVGNYIITKKSVDYTNYLGLAPSLPLYARLIQTKSYISRNEISTSMEIGNTYSKQREALASPQTYALLTKANGRVTLEELLRDQKINGSEERKTIINELAELWARRVVLLNPV